MSRSAAKRAALTPEEFASLRQAVLNQYDDERNLARNIECPKCQAAAVTFADHRREIRETALAKIKPEGGDDA